MDEKLFSHLWSLVKSSSRRLFVPSGAIAGLDALKAAALGRIYDVTLTTRKPPESLSGAPYFDQHKIDLYGIKEPTLVYEGSALEACSLFPANVNVAASVSLAGIGPEKTKVQIIARFRHISEYDGIDAQLVQAGAFHQAVTGFVGDGKGLLEQGVGLGVPLSLGMSPAQGE